ncbi:hypothetical protein J1N35_001122 [Gossypium stocksii]|uniref:Uncharacterized protein n=1 Tax=Gossypium stocksii TaxID=47602 RepID=A0A9D3WIA5_9ROSI|nr:hypothetical protein J1N35_001122 [Gossypium stocksii]
MKWKKSKPIEDKNERPEDISAPRKRVAASSCYNTSKPWHNMTISKSNPQKPVVVAQHKSSYALWILKKEQICIGHWIYKEMMKCLRSRKQSMYFPILITTLCRRAEVPMSPIEPLMRPKRSAIGDNMYRQFVELQRKQK